VTPQERRIFFRHALSPLFLPFYDELCKELSDNWAPYSGYRSFTEQDALYAKGRTLAPFGRGHVVTNARAGESAHNWGCGVDFTWFDDDGELRWLKKEDPVWKNYIETVGKLGLRPGADFGDTDHCELKLSCSWKDVLAEYSFRGMDAANAFIKSKMI
jgi:hypothetical protein